MTRYDQIMVPTHKQLVTRTSGLTAMPRSFLRVSALSPVFNNSTSRGFQCVGPFFFFLYKVWSLSFFPDHWTGRISREIYTDYLYTKVYTSSIFLCRGPKVNASIIDSVHELHRVLASSQNSLV